MRLIEVADADFRKSEATLYKLWEAANPEAKMATNDVVLFVSLSGNQLVFVHKPRQLEDGHALAGTREVISSRRLRIKGGVWNPMMIGNYARDVGITIERIKLFEDHYRAKYGTNT